MFKTSTWGGGQGGPGGVSVGALLCRSSIAGAYGAHAGSAGGGGSGEWPTYVGGTVGKAQDVLEGCAFP